MTGERSDGDPAIVLAHVAQIVEPSNVDELRRADDAQPQGRHQGVAARQELRLFVAREQLDRLFDRLGPLVLEGCRDHAPALAAA